MEANTKTVLEEIAYIWYLIQFLGHKVYANKVKALIDSNSKVNAMTSAYAAKLRLSIWKTSVETQIMDSITLKTYDIISAKFIIKNSL